MSSVLDEMTPREMCAGLMYGNRAEFKLGYDPVAAALAAARYHRLEQEDYEDLLSFARGVSDGLAYAVERAFPDRRYQRTLRPAEDRVRAYSEGYADGVRSDGFRVNPALSRTESTAA